MLTSAAEGRMILTANGKGAQIASILRSAFRIAAMASMSRA